MMLRERVQELMPRGNIHASLNGQRLCIKEHSNSRVGLDGKSDVDMSVEDLARKVRLELQTTRGG